MPQDRKADVGMLNRACAAPAGALSISRASRLPRNRSARCWAFDSELTPLIPFTMLLNRAGWCGTACRTLPLIIHEAAKAIPPNSSSRCRLFKRDSDHPYGPDFLERHNCLCPACAMRRVAPLGPSVVLSSWWSFPPSTPRGANHFLTRGSDLDNNCWCWKLFAMAGGLAFGTKAGMGLNDMQLASSYYDGGASSAAR
jgi:hypothetical protein